MAASPAAGLPAGVVNAIVGSGMNNTVRIGTLERRQGGR